eukprot:SAG22_NODE_4007_length_1427_cov_51.781627_2_plen_137_part_01
MMISALASNGTAATTADANVQRPLGPASKRQKVAAGGMVLAFQEGKGLGRGGSGASEEELLSPPTTPPIKSTGSMQSLPGLASLHNDAKQHLAVLPHNSCICSPDTPLLCNDRMLQHWRCSSCNNQVETVPCPDCKT